MVEGLSFILGLFLVFLLPLALGESLFPRFTYIGTRVATGWLLITLMMVLLALLGILQVNTILILSSFLLIFYGKKMTDNLIRFWEEIKILFRSYDFIFKCLLCVIFILLCLRFCRAFVPLLNWDSLNNHLLLLREKLMVGDFSLQYNIPTERRVPFLGVLAKCWAFSFDETARVLTLAHFSMYFYIALSFYQVFKVKVSRFAGVLAMSFYLALVEVMVNSITAGDEALMSLIVSGLFLFFIQSKDDIKAIDYHVLFLLLGLLIGIKMTALFWIPLIFLWMVYILRQQKVTLLVGVILFLFISSVSYIYSYYHYNIVYPFSRWSNLLYDGSKDEKKAFTKAEMLEDRLMIGLTEHRDHGSLMASPLKKFYQNIIRLGKLPIGPFFLWFFFFICLAIKKKKYIEYKNIKIALGLMLFCGFSFMLSMIVWKFTPLAMYRYHSPTWAVFVLACSFVILIMCDYLKILSYLSKLMMIYLIFNIALEAKYVNHLYAKGSVLDAEKYWEENSAEGKIVNELDALLKEDEKVFYIGINCFLLKGEGHYYAQIGNETGWRWLADIPDFLQKNNIKYWVLCKGSRILDEPYYYTLTDYLAQQGVLEKVQGHSQGEIYKINYK